MTQYLAYIRYRIKCEKKFEEYFQKKDYGSEQMKDITIIINCRNPEITFHQRIELSKKEQKLYIDLMFDFNEVVKLDHESRCKLVAKKFVEEIPPVIARYIIRKQVTNFGFQDLLKI